MTHDRVEPTGWMIRAQRATHTRSARQYGEMRVLCGRVFMNEETALAAAHRLTNRWRRCEAFPVYGPARTDLARHCTMIADLAVPAYRSGVKSYGCASHTAKRWQAAWDGACLALGGRPEEYRS